MGNRGFILVVSLVFCVLCGIATADLIFADPPAKHDNFWTLGEMNKASIIMLKERGIIPKDLAAKIARAIEQVNTAGNKPGAERPSDYLRVEAALADVGGPEVSRVHSGRSRQDMMSVTQRMFLRESLLDTVEHLNKMRERLLVLAANHRDTIIPAYTHGVQSQPTTLAHYLLAWVQSFDRDAERFRQTYARINLSPMGAAAGVTSSFQIDRMRLAELLGFEGIVENSLDANFLSPAQTNTDYASDLAMSALAIGMLAQDIHVQYHQPYPWFMLKEGPLTGISSIMPQKRNPSALENVRMLASHVISGAHATYIQAHNTTIGMNDDRSSLDARTTANDAQSMYDLLGKILDGLIIDRERALAEVNADYSTTSELADKLQQVANVPFRTGHHFASELTNYGRANKLKPDDIPYNEAASIYQRETGQVMPLTEKQFRDALSASHMISASKGIGGPQPSEVNRMLVNARKRLGDDGDWIKKRKAKLLDAEANLQRQFSDLAGTAQ